MKDLYQALFDLSQELPALPKDGKNPHFGSKFTKYDTIMEKIGPLLGKYELLWLAGPSHNEGTPTLAYSLIHLPSGDRLDGEMLLMVDKQNPQGQGSALTYARRYCITTVLNLIADEDDDGNAASQAPKARRSTGSIASFAEQVKAAGLEAKDIRLYLGLKTIPVPQGMLLKDFLNNELAPKQQAELLAYANGDPQ